MAHWNVSKGCGDKRTKQNKLKCATGLIHLPKSVMMSFRIPTTSAIPTEIWIWVQCGIASRSLVGWMNHMELVSVISKSVFRYCKVSFYPPNIDIVLFYWKYSDIGAQYQEVYTDILILSVFFSIIMKTFKNMFVLFIQT